MQIRIFLLIVTVIQIAFSQEILFSYIGPRYVRQNLEVEDTDLGCQSAREEIERLRKQYPARDLYLLRLCGKSGSCPMGYPSSKPLSYKGHIKMHDLLLADRPAIAEAIATSAGTVVRVRKGSGTVERCVSGEEDPLEIKIGSKIISLIWVEYSESLWPDGNIENLDVFAITPSRVTAQEAMSAFQVLTGRFPATALELVIGSQPWFPGLTTFPAYYPFSERYRPPLESEHDTLGIAECTSSPEVRCNTSNR